MFEAFHFSSPCETRRSCILLPIDDDVPEYEDEYYTLSLISYGLHEWIQVDETSYIIRITDDDGMISKTCLY